MNSTSTQQTPGRADNDVFAPLTEAQMDSIRGGTSWPDWFVDMVGDIVDSATNALDYLDTVMDAPPLDFEQDYWDDVETHLQNEGFVIPDSGAP